MDIRQTKFGHVPVNDMVLAVIVDVAADLAWMIVNGELAIPSKQILFG
jgi:hypothetical protein